MSTEQRSGRYRLIRAAGLQLAVFAAGSVGYHILTDRQYDLLTCAFMTAITLTTAGYEEVVPINTPELQVFTIALILFGMGAVLYFVSALTAFIIDGELREFLRERKISGMLEELSNHFVIAGTGDTGKFVLLEMVKLKRPVVLIDMDRERIAALEQEYGFQIPFVVGDATDDDVLIRAGLERAQGVVFSLGNDRDNLFATISARRLSANLRIVTRGEDPRSEKKFLMAGATSVIYTNVLGGLRMAAEVTRPRVTTFLDLVMRDHDHFRIVEEIPVPDGSPLAGRSIKHANFRGRTDALIIAIHEENDEYRFNPGPDYVIRENTQLIVLALGEDIKVIEKMLKEG
ncbi:MAG: potassium channel protein [bacterium]